VPIAAVGSLPMAITIVNIAAIAATSPIALEGVLLMNEKQFLNELVYEATMAVAREMLTKGIITQQDYEVLDSRMVEKYTPLAAGIKLT